MHTRQETAWLKKKKKHALRHPGSDLMIISFVSIHDVSTCRDLFIVVIGNWQGDIQGGKSIFELLCCFSFPSLSSVTSCKLTPLRKLVQMTADNNP